MLSWYWETFPRRTQPDSQSKMPQRGSALADSCWWGSTNFLGIASAVKSKKTMIDQIFFSLPSLLPWFSGINDKKEKGANVILSNIRGGCVPFPTNNICFMNWAPRARLFIQKEKGTEKELCEIFLTTQKCFLGFIFQVRRQVRFENMIIF